MKLGLAAMCLLLVSSELLLLQCLACHSCLHDDAGAWSFSKRCGDVDDSRGARATSLNLRGYYLTPSVSVPLLRWVRLQLGPNWQAVNTIEACVRVKYWPLLRNVADVGIVTCVLTHDDYAGSPWWNLLFDLMFSNLVRRPSLSPFLTFCNSSHNDIRETWHCSVSQCFETHEFLFLANFMLGILGCVWGGSLPFRLSPLHGIRIGEAAHPGPCQYQDLRLCVLNPTAVFRKTPAFHRLNVHVLFLAETSATSTTQEIETRELRKHAFETHWGYPVQPCKSDYALPGTAKRGKAAGVAIASQLPTRRVLPPVPVEWDKTCRYAETWIRMGSLQVLSIVIYAFVDGPDSVTKNAMLLAFACQRASLCNSCAIISGDFNKSLAHESTWANIQQLGFVDALQLARERWPHQVYPTCGGATWNDTLLVRGPLLASLHDAKVLKDHSFGPHLPFVVTFRVPCQTLSRQVWQLPRDFTALPIKQDEIADKYQSPPIEPTPDEPDREWHARRLLMWSQACETAVARSMPVPEGATETPSSLPAQYAGRCRPVVFRRAQAPVLVKPSADTIANPTCDVISFDVTLTTRQLRRLRTYQRTLCASLRLGISEARNLQMSQEWKAIRRARGFKMSFPNWAVLRTGCWFDNPSSSETALWLSDLIYQVKNQLDETIKWDRLSRHETLGTMLTYDWHCDGGRLTCSLLKPRAASSLSHLAYHRSFPYIVLRAGAKQPPKIRVTCPHDLIRGDVICFSGTNVTIQNIAGDVLTLSEMPAAVLATGCFTIQEWTTSPTEVAEQLENTWVPFWQRDPAEFQTDGANWGDALALCRQFAARLDDWQSAHVSPDAWAQAICKTKPYSAKGACGWSRKELASLPPQALSDLCEIFSCLIQSAAWPDWLVTARTVFLLKDPSMPAPSNTRPLTIFPLLFRLWSKIWVSELLRRLDSVLPASITGGLPGRSTTDVYWPLQLKVEQSLLEDGEGTRYGYVLDLTKCFNLLSRYLATVLLQFAGLPPCIARAWQAAMFRCVRVLQVCGHSSAPIPSTTGVAEGDPAGPLIMILVAAVWTHMLAAEHAALEPFAFADNLEVTTSSFPAAVAAVEANHKFHVALRNQINYNKSWCWATTKDGRACWHAYLLTLPEHRRFPVRNTGVDLGAQMSYTKQNAAVAKNRRIDEAIRRANAIPTLPLCVSDAAKAIRTAVLSVGLFGVEGNVPAHDKLHELRLAIAYALTGFDTRKKGQHSGNAWVACSTLTDFIVDPTFECCKLVFKNIAYWAKKDRALALTAWDLACCYQRASDAHQPMRRLNGPGQALWTVCQVLGWKLLPDLTLTDKRKTFQNLDSFHPSRTGIALRKCHKGHRKTLTGLLLGTHSSVEQRKHWQSASQLLCPLCKLGEDTVMHTVIHCPELVNEREKWAGMLQGLPLDDELLFCFPSVPATQWDDEIAMILWDLSLPQPSFGAGCIGERFCYTDGSCDVLHECSHPVAAWSIVLDAAATMQERALLGQLALSDVQTVASRFSVLQCGNVPRKQSVNRAELSALAVLLRAHPAVTVFTDSQYAKTIVGAVAQNPDTKIYHRAKNFDLLLHLCETFNGTTARPTITWIGSHQTPEQRFLPEYNLAIVGNTVADTAANFARRCSPQELLRPVNAARAEVKAHTERCFQLMTCVAELSEAKWIKQSKLSMLKPRGALAPDAELPQSSQDHPVGRCRS